MPEFYSYEGLRNGGTFLLDETTAEAVVGKPINEVLGKVVALVDNYTVGYGKAGDKPLGFIEMLEHERNFSKQMTVSVVWNQSQEGVACAGSELVTDDIACDGKGGIMKSTKATKASLYGVDKDAKTATVYIHG